MGIDKINSLDSKILEGVIRLDPQTRCVSVRSTDVTNPSTELGRQNFTYVNQNGNKIFAVSHDGTLYFVPEPQTLTRILRQGKTVVLLFSIPDRGSATEQLLQLAAKT